MDLWRLWTHLCVRGLLRVKGTTSIIDVWDIRGLLRVKGTTSIIDVWNYEKEFCSRTYTCKLADWRSVERSNSHISMVCVILMEGGGGEGVREEEEERDARTTRLSSFQLFRDACSFFSCDSIL